MIHILITNKRVICVFVLLCVCTVCERCSGSWSSHTTGRRVPSCPTSPLVRAWLLGPHAWMVLCCGFSAQQHNSPLCISVAARSILSRSWEDIDLVIIWALWKSFPSHTVTEIDRPDGLLSHTVIPLNLCVYVCVCVYLFILYSSVWSSHVQNSAFSFQKKIGALILLVASILCHLEFYHILWTVPPSSEATDSSVYVAEH